jgi:hypothetical protein
MVSLYHSSKTLLISAFLSRTLARIPRRTDIGPQRRLGLDPRRFTKERHGTCEGESGGARGLGERVRYTKEKERISLSTRIAMGWRLTPYQR